MDKETIEIVYFWAREQHFNEIMEFFKPKTMNSSNKKARISR